MHSGKKTADKVATTASGAAEALTHEKPWRSWFARLHPKLYLSLHAVVGILLSMGLLWAFLAIAEDVPENGSMVRFDAAVAVWFHLHETEWLEGVFYVISLIGAPVLAATLAAAAILFLVKRDWRRLGALGVTVGGGGLLNLALKSGFHRVRPVYASEFHPHGWSFPSGHAMDSLIGYGMLAFFLAEQASDARMRRLIGGLAATLILAIGFGRIYLGVHFLSDVVGGFAAGALWLGVCITGYRFARRRHVSTSSGNAPAKTA